MEGYDALYLTEKSQTGQKMKYAVEINVSRLIVNFSLLLEPTLVPCIVSPPILQNPFLIGHLGV